MIRSRQLLSGLILAAAAQAMPAAAKLPDPAHSTVDPVLMICPEGDAVFRVKPRDFANNPDPGVNVTLAFDSCPPFAVCPDVAGDPTPYKIDRVNRTITRMATLSASLEAVAEFSIRMGGICPSSLLTVYADGVPLASRSVVSPDQDGDLDVDDADLALLEAKVGQADPTGDFDGDGIVTAADVEVLRAHTGHACLVLTHISTATWGRLKLLYR